MWAFIKETKPRHSDSLFLLLFFCDRREPEGKKKRKEDKVRQRKKGKDRDCNGVAIYFFPKIPAMESVVDQRLQRNDTICSASFI